MHCLSFRVFVIGVRQIFSLFSHILKQISTIHDADIDYCGMGFIIRNSHMVNTVESITLLKRLIRK